MRFDMFGKKREVEKDERRKKKEERKRDEVGPLLLYIFVVTEKYGRKSLQEVLLEVGVQ